MIGLAFALDHEASGIARLLTGAPVESFRLGEMPCRVGEIGGKKVALCIVGMGAETAGRRAALIVEHFDLEVVVLAGYAGALVPAWKRNTVAVAENYLSPEATPWGGTFLRAKLFSAPAVAGTPGARAALAKEGYELVDMETAAVAAALAGRVPFLPLRAVSDEAGDVLPTAALEASFDVKTQRPNALKLMAHLATHPRDIAPFARFVGHLGPAREALTEAVVRVIGA